MRLVGPLLLLTFLLIETRAVAGWGMTTVQPGPSSMVTEATQQGAKPKLGQTEWLEHPMPVPGAEVNACPWGRGQWEHAGSCLSLGLRSVGRHWQLGSAFLTVDTWWFWTNRHDKAI